MAGKVDLKVVLLGKEFGGKTSLVERYIHNKFSAQAPYQSVSLRMQVVLTLTKPVVSWSSGSRVKKQTLRILTLHAQLSVVFCFYVATIGYRVLM